ncbi:MAG: NADH-quinone oxidoreductase subunit NuoK [Candidatus Omnitrophica bacterium CG11_big_fil_rev_8_21_14_0_20_64_10]|nr:MAG: NADH-quinone oxidoreductase subunit NuoK [Candidatus Omnitrophica bacterium CG11_big_fil_rev_8_21_14_0_20_64_10]
MGLNHLLGVSALLLIIGLMGVICRRNIIMILLGLEIMLAAGNLAFVAFARANGNLAGQIMVFFVMIVAAAEVTVGLAIAVVLARKIRSVNADEMRQLKW